MMENAKTATDYELEIESIDVELESLGAIVENLKTRRCRLVTKRKQIDIAAALECIEETGINVDDILDLINKELTFRRFVAHEIPS